MWGQEKPKQKPTDRRLDRRPKTDATKKKIRIPRIKRKFCPFMPLCIHSGLRSVTAQQLKWEGEKKKKKKPYKRMVPRKSNLPAS